MLSKCHGAKIVKDQLNNTRCSFCLNHTTSKLNIRLYFIIGFLSMIMLGASTNIKSGKMMSYISSNRIIIDTCDIELCDSTLLRELIKDSCILPSIAIAQAKIESDYYRSYKCKTYFNIFGIKPHKCKYAIGEWQYQATYKSYKDNIACYCDIQRLYLKNIDGHYAQNSAYVNLIKQIK